MRILTAAGLAMAMLALAACGGGSGGRSTTTVENTTVSTGQALIDLKNAYDAGALSKSEYERQRQRILDQ